jgi:FixJ family two-component response regulator
VNNTDSIVYIVDDDSRIREALSDMLAAAGFRVVAFESAAAYMIYPRPEQPSCLILDVELPDINGLDLLQQLVADRHPPVVFITGHGDIPKSVQAMKGGAIDFLPKPFRQEDLVAAIRVALNKDEMARSSYDELHDLRACHESLTPREREVLGLVVSGLLNKQSAAELGISEVTFQIHRGNVMRKMKAASLSDLVRMSSSLNIPLHRWIRGKKSDVAATEPHGLGPETHDDR